MSKRTRLLSKLKYVYSHNTKLVLDVSNDDIGLIIEGVEKQIAKKVINKRDSYDDDDGWEYTEANCPNCESYLRDWENAEYCDSCGQKIDWSEADD